MAALPQGIRSPIIDTGKGIRRRFYLLEKVSKKFIPIQLASLDFWKGSIPSSHPRSAEKENWGLQTCIYYSPNLREK
jgi:hypothetical protein